MAESSSLGHLPVRLPPSGGRQKSELVSEIALTILQGFDKHFSIFRQVTQRGREHFIRGDWQLSRQAACERISLYDKRVQEAVAVLRERFDPDNPDPELWQQVKFHYLGMLYRHQQPELAETFYNSVFVCLFQRHYYNNDYIFVRPCVSTERLDTSDPVYLSFYPTQRGWRQTITHMLQQADIGLPFEDIHQDVRRIVRDMRQLKNRPAKLLKHFQIQMLRPLFYRNHTAYMVGRVINGPDRLPFILKLRRNERGRVHVLGLLSELDDVANLFTSARAYFLVDTETPSAVVRFLLSILSEKEAADIYTQIGFHKQGKAEFYRNFLDHLARSSDQIQTAPGARGMVMLVFTLPSYPYVFKLIRDRFAPPKEVTRQQVIDRYHMVKQHDRVGRMSDAWEFSYTAFPVDRFSEQLLQELLSEAPSQITVEDDRLIIKHLFIERRLEPLNLYLERADARSAQHALQEYGDAIHEIATAGLFPGDLLTKNFGVTRYGRVVFYDYDEVVPLSDCNFRFIPPARYPEDELAAEPWYSVGPADVFPEEFPPFLFRDPAHRSTFVQQHGRLLDADHWKQIQQVVADGGFAE